MINRLSKGKTFLLMLSLLALPGLTMSAGADEQRLLLVQLDPYHLDADGLTLIQNFDDVEAFNFKSLEEAGAPSLFVRLAKATAHAFKGVPRLVPMFALDSESGVKYEPLEAQVIESGGANPCEGSLICAFQMTEKDLQRMDQGESLVIFLHDKNVIPSDAAKANAITHFTAVGCRPNTLCKLHTSERNLIAGEVVVHAKPSGICLPKNAAYLKRLYITSALINGKTREKLSGKMFNTQFSSAIVIDYPPYLDSKQGVKQVEAFTRCVDPKYLGDLLSFLVLRQKLDGIELFSAASFMLVEHLPRQAVSFRTRVRSGDIDAHKSLNSKDEQAGAGGQSDTVEMDFGELINMLQDAYESSSEILLPTTALTKVSVTDTVNRNLPGESWTAPVGD